MADYAEWAEGTAGIAAGDADGEADLFDFDILDEQAPQPREGDAVVFLVDCNEGMFCHAARDDPHTQLSSSNYSVANAAPTYASTASPRFSKTTQAQAKDAASGSFFPMAMQSIHTFLLERIVSSTEDVVAVVLFNTHLSVSPSATTSAAVGDVSGGARADFPGVVVVQGATRIGTQCIQCVEQLQAAGENGSTAVNEFAAACVRGQASSGHCSSSSPAVLASASALPTICRFSDALHVARNIMVTACGAAAFNKRRLFVFTNQSDPTSGSIEEAGPCDTEARELAKAGVSLEVFGFEGGSAAQQSPPLSASPYIYSSSVSASDCRPSVAPFNPSVWWTPLLHTMESTPVQLCTSQPECVVPSDSSPTARDASMRMSRLVEKEVGAVHVHAGAAALHQLLSTIAHRAHPQRPVHHCELRIGAPPPQDEESPSAAARVPRMAVNVYAPLMPAKAFPHELVDGQTQRLVRRAVHLQRGERPQGDGAEEREPPVKGRGGDQRTAFGGRPFENEHTILGNEEGHGDSTGEVAPEEVHLCFRRGVDAVFFTPAERRRIVEVAAAGAAPGFTILLFKDRNDAALRCHAIQRASFLNPCEQQGGTESHRLFVLLVRRLREKKRVAIAQYRRSSRSAPQLVTLVPSPDLSQSPSRRGQLPVEGLGLYVLPLPYAEDLRAMPDLNSSSVVIRGNTPYIADAHVRSEHRELAQQIISALTVTYNTDTVMNPTLQRQREVLQQLAQRLYPFTHGFSDASRDDEREENVVRQPLSQPQNKPIDPQTHDSTLPDYAGMRCYSRLFDAFRESVLGSSYDADALCPQPAAARVVMRRPRELDCTDVGVEDYMADVAEHSTLQLVAVPVLKMYLTRVGVNVGAVTRKADLIELVKTHLRSKQNKA